MGMMVFGFTLFSFFVCIADGGYEIYIDHFIRERTGHLQIHQKGYLDNPRFFTAIKDPKTVTDDLGTFSEIESTSSRIHFGSLSFFKKKTQGVQIMAVDPEKEAMLTTLKKRVNRGVYFSGSSGHEVILGKGVSEVLKAKVGSDIYLIGQGADGSIANDSFKVIGIIDHPGRGMDDQKVYMPLRIASEFLSFGDRIHEISLIVKDGTNIPKLKKKLQQKLGDGLEVSSWEEVEKDFYKAMQADKKGDTVARFILILVMAIGVFNTVLMSILERTREFGVIKAIGGRPIDIAKLIFIENFIMALFSIAIGSIFSTFLNYYFSKYGIDLATPIEWGGIIIKEIKGKVMLACYTTPSKIILTTTFFVCLYPSWMAMKILPSKAMRAA
jgi:putative ABC transport system permease protein